MTYHQFEAVTSQIGAMGFLILLCTSTSTIGIIASGLFCLIYLASYLNHYSETKKEFRK